MAAPCGSTSTAMRPTVGTSNGSAQIFARSFLAFLTV
jgi:hypothetical protein